jgi:hypothetical protein
VRLRGLLVAHFSRVVVIGRADIEIDGPSVGRMPTAVVSSTAGLVANCTLLKLVQA